jgi:hypothetical protein
MDSWTTTTTTAAASYTNHLEVILRVSQAVCALLTFATGTAMTGFPVGNFAFILSYTVLLYSFWTIVCAATQKHSMNVPPSASLFSSKRPPVILDSAVTIMLVLAGIAVSFSRAFSFCSAHVSCASAYACVFLLFVGSILQGVSVRRAIKHYHIQQAQNEATHDDIGGIESSPVETNIAYREPSPTKATK